MLPVVGVVPEGEALPDEFLPQGNIDRDLSQRGLGIVVAGVHARSGETDPMARPQQEDPLVGMPPRDAAEGRSRHLPAEHVPGMRDDDGLRSGVAG